jgi:hypothetical protein
MSSSTASQQGQQAQGKTGVSTSRTAEREKLSGKCAYVNCPYKENDETENFATLKNTDYKFHTDCLDKWRVESRDSARFSMQDRIAVLDEQSGKTKKTTAAAEAKK